MLEIFLPEHSVAIQVCPYKYILNGILKEVSCILAAPLHSCLVTIRGEIEVECCIRIPGPRVPAALGRGREGRAELPTIPWCIYSPAPD